MRFTLAQLRAYTAAADRDERQRMAAFAVAMRVAFAADAAGWQQFQQSMTGQAPAHKSKEKQANG